MINSNWPRWILASTATHFQTVCSDLHLFVEGDVRDTDKYPNYYELRVDGPYIDELSSNTYAVDCTINTLVCAVKNDSNIYTLEDNIGKVLKGFTNSFTVYQLGDTELLDGNGDPLPPIVEGCMVIQPNSAISVTKFGQIRSDLRLMQAQVEASYRMLIK